MCSFKLNCEHNNYVDLENRKMSVRTTEVEVKNRAVNNYRKSAVKRQIQDCGGK